MSMILLKLLYGIYFFGMAFIIWNAGSRLVFNRRKLKIRIKEFLGRVFVAIFWPIMISKDGLVFINKIFKGKF